VCLRYLNMNSFGEIWVREDFGQCKPTYIGIGISVTFCRPCRYPLNQFKTDYIPSRNPSDGTLIDRAGGAKRIMRHFYTCSARLFPSPLIYV